MLTTIKLYGHLAKRFGKQFEFDIATVSESIRALDANLPGFKQYLVEYSEPGYRVIVDNHPVMDITELGLCAHANGVIKIVPVVQGAGNGKSVGQIILGAVLVVAAVAMMVVSGGALAPFAIPMGMTGITMIAGGIMGLLSSVPVSDSAKQANNQGFSNNQDTIVQGLRVPIGYGRMLCEGYPISVRLVIEND